MAEDMRDTNSSSVKCSSASDELTGGALRDRVVARDRAVAGDFLVDTDGREDGGGGECEFSKDLRCCNRSTAPLLVPNFCDLVGFFTGLADDDLPRARDALRLTTSLLPCRALRLVVRSVAVLSQSLEYTDVVSVPVSDRRSEMILFSSLKTTPRTFFMLDFRFNGWEDGWGGSPEGIICG